ncbi:MAG: hypothetical protein AAGE94_25030 [Acidobacteriota bacterium]
MQRIHLLRVDAEPASFATLAEALVADGGRLGWLDWSPDREADEPSATTVDPALVDAASLPTLRAVAVERGRTVMIKPQQGAPVLMDVVREHFRGCRVVLVRGDLPNLPSLEATEDGYRIVTPSFDRTVDADALAARLRRPRPFGSND